LGLTTTSVYDEDNEEEEEEEEGSDVTKISNNEITIYDVAISCAKTSSVAELYVYSTKHWLNVRSKNDWQTAYTARANITECR